MQICGFVFISAGAEPGAHFLSPGWSWLTLCPPLQKLLNGHSVISFAITLNFLFFLCVPENVEVWGQVVGVGSLLPPHGL